MNLYTVHIKKLVCFTITDNSYQCSLVKIVSIQLVNAIFHCQFLMSRITTMEQHCIDADEEVKQEKKITEEWKERVWELEKKVTQLEQSIHSADNVRFCSTPWC